MNTKLIVIALVVLSTLMFLLGYKTAFDKIPQKAETPTAEAIQEAVKMALEPYRVALQSANELLEQEQAFTYKLIDSLAKAGQYARSKPAKPVTVTSIYSFECDSAKLVGKALVSENEKLRLALTACQELSAVQDTALLDLGAELEAAEQRHYEDQAEVAAIKKQAQAEVNAESRKKKAWRIAAIALAIKETADYLLSR